MRTTHFYLFQHVNQESSDVRISNAFMARSFAMELIIVEIIAMKQIVVIVSIYITLYK